MTIKIMILVELWLIDSIFWPPAARPCHIVSFLTLPLPPSRGIISKMTSTKVSKQCYLGYSMLSRCVCCRTHTYLSTQSFQRYFYVESINLERGAYFTCSIGLLYPLHKPTFSNCCSPYRSINGTFV